MELWPKYLQALCYLVALVFRVLQQQFPALASQQLVLGVKACLLRVGNAIGVLSLVDEQLAATGSCQ